jgi:hypothetical protein
MGTTLSAAAYHRTDVREARTSLAQTSVCVCVSFIIVLKTKDMAS